MTKALQKCYSTQLSENRRPLPTARRRTATRRRARLRWQRSLRAGGGNRPALPLARPLGSFQASGYFVPRASPDRLERALGSRDKAQFPEFIGALGGIRTPDPQIRSLVLYPAELRALGTF